MNISERLKFARESLGLRLAAVKDVTGIDDSCLSSYENGKTEPKFSQLAQLAELYRVPVSFFFEEGPIEKQVVLWRDKPDNEAQIQAEFVQLCKQYRQLELWGQELQSTQLPDFDEFGEIFGYAQAAELASSVRKLMGFGEQPAQGLLNTLEEKYGVKVFHLDLGHLGSAACAKSPLWGNAILLNKNSSRWRRNHDLAHELFHLLTWERFDHTSGVCDPNQFEEKLATCFAGNLLLPDESVRQAISKMTDDFGKVPLSKLDSVARQFDVSLESLLWRMHFLNNWKEEQTKGYIGQAKEYVSHTKREETACPSKYPERYRALAIRVFRNGDISLGRFAKLMEISRKEAEQYLDRDVDHEIPTAAA
ncbi:MAG: XRE family transcriptional regulator [Planctomycetaceae bacterium]|nr:XRE family transcriptional regulator [Planctomycetaceae bacterium]